jgi:hypothetical protein
MVMNLRVGKFLSNCAIGGSSRGAQLHGVAYLYLKVLTYCINLWSSHIDGKDENGRRKPMKEKGSSM